MLSVIGVWSVLAAVPMPTQKPLNVAPLTLAYGQQPPNVGPLPRVQAQTIIASWPDAGEPRLQFKNQQPERRYIVALSLVYGQQPPIAGPLSVQEMAIARTSWEPPFQFPQELEGIAAVYIPPVVNNPPPFSPQQHVVRFAWEPPFVYPESEANSAGWNVPVVAQSYLGPNQVPWWIGASWRDPLLDIQYSGGFVPSAAVGDQPPVVGSLSATEMAIARWSWEPARPEPPALIKVAPLTLAYGQQAPNVGPLPQLVYIVAQTPAIWWPSQSEPDNAHWNVPVVSAYAAYTRQQDAIVRAWLVDWSAQSEADTAGWNFPPAVVNNPPTFARLQFQVLAPAIWWPSQSASPNASWNILAALTRAIAQSIGIDAIVGNSGTIAIISALDATVSIISTE